ncbi:hypothetical protein Thiowin_02869 [Thiorhodovibrio winogradskyi]|uniref:SH3b domain-containing protein n=1 Tax=Thiorhodovibrio winogradskyi TaxID=77007 RepID=A0ABZ0SBJ5_9GAMM|nr:hypothetical protein [Thiorhodovibrio winogradskyi]
MKNQLMAIALGAALSVVALQANAETYSAQHENVKKLFQSNEEKTAKDAVWTSRDIFKVGVINEGSRRDGYADYVCQVLYDYGFKGKKVWVQVIDIVKLTRNGDWVKLGESHCQ